jgi:HprK-related kinase B
MRINEQSVAMAAAHIRQTHPAPYGLKIRIDNMVFAISANTKTIAEHLSAYFATFLTDADSRADTWISVHETPEPQIGQPLADYQPEPGKSKVKERFVELSDGRIVKKSQTGLVFVFGSGVHLAAGPCLKNLNQIVNFINNRFIEIKLNQGGLLGHAAGVARQNTGLALAGFSGTGKSSLALKLLSRGANFISNDRLILMKREDMTRMVGVPKHPRVNPGTLLNNEDLAGILSAADQDRYRRLSDETLWHLDEKYDVRIEDAFKNSRFLLSAPMKGLVILNWRRKDARMAIEAIDPGEKRDLLPALIKSPGIFYYPDSISVEQPPPSAYIHALSGCDVFEISGGIDFEKAADFFIDYLESGAAAVCQAQ